MLVTRLAVTTFGFCLCIPASSSLLAQAGRAAAPVREAIRVFFDCHTFCDFEYTRREITYVNWVRDRQDADVHLIIRAQRTGGGGDEFTLQFIGRRAFQGTNDELRFTTRQSDTEDETRRRQIQRIGLGLVRYLARSASADRVRVSYSAPTGTAAAPVQELHDPWNLWVFRLSASASLSGETQFKQNSLSGSLGADRVSELWKFRVAASANRNNSTYTLSDGSPYKSHTSRYSGTSLLVGSLGGHWSAGVEVDASRSTRDNYDLNLQGAGEIEFDVFPYAESSRHQFVFVYAVGVLHSNYRDTTIFNKMVETRPLHTLTVAAEATQPWGSLTATLVGSAYLDDFSKNRLSAFGYCSVRLVRGLNLNLSGGYTRVRDQLSLVKAGLTDEEILLQLKQLRTDYNYFASVSLSFSFGSKFNNVVNPRFTHSGGGGGSCECFGGSCFCN
jgi:hypothetical protein